MTWNVSNKTRVYLRKAAEQGQIDRTARRLSIPLAGEQNHRLAFNSIECGDVPCLHLAIIPDRLAADSAPCLHLAIIPDRLAADSAPCLHLAIIPDRLAADSAPCLHLAIIPDRLAADSAPCLHLAIIPDRLAADSAPCLHLAIIPDRLAADSAKPRAWPGSGNRGRAGRIGDRAKPRGRDRPIRDSAGNQGLTRQRREAILTYTTKEKSHHQRNKSPDYHRAHWE